MPLVSGASRVRFPLRSLRGLYAPIPASCTGSAKARLFLAAAQRRWAELDRAHAGRVKWHAAANAIFSLCSRGRESDPTTLEAFRALEQAEATRTEESGQDLDGTAALADRVIPNEQSFDELSGYVAEALRDLGVDFGG